MWLSGWKISGPEHAKIPRVMKLGRSSISDGRVRGGETGLCVGAGKETAVSWKTRP